MKFRFVLLIVIGLFTGPFQASAEPISPKHQIGFGGGLSVIGGSLFSNIECDGAGVIGTFLGIKVGGKGRFFISPKLAIVGVIEYNRHAEPSFGASGILSGVYVELLPLSSKPISPYLGFGLGLFFDKRGSDISAVTPGILLEAGLVIFSTLDVNLAISDHSPTFEGNELDLYPRHPLGHPHKKKESWPIIALTASIMVPLGS